MKISSNKLAALAALAIIGLQGVTIISLGAQLSKLSAQTRALSAAVMGDYEEDENSLVSAVEDAKTAAEEARDAAGACRNSN